MLWFISMLVIGLIAAFVVAALVRRSHEMLVDAGREAVTSRGTGRLARRL